MAAHTVRQFLLKPGVHALALPRGAQILSVANLNGVATAFALVDAEEQRLALRQIAVIPSGVEAPADARFIGTLLMRPRIEGAPGMAVHVFETAERAAAVEAPAGDGADAAPEVTS
jgi:hypothetical protein